MALIKKQQKGGMVSIKPKEGWKDAAKDIGDLQERYIKKYGNIENAFENLKSLDNKSLRQNLTEEGIKSAVEYLDAYNKSDNKENWGKIKEVQDFLNFTKGVDVTTEEGWNKVKNFTDPLGWNLNDYFSQTDEEERQNLETQQAEQARQAQFNIYKQHGIQDENYLNTLHQLGFTNVNTGLNSNISNFLKSKNYNYFTNKDGNAYVFDSSGNLVNKGFGLVTEDQFNPDYGKVWAIQDGVLGIGNYNESYAENLPEFSDEGNLRRRLILGSYDPNKKIDLKGYDNYIYGDSGDTITDYAKDIFGRRDYSKYITLTKDGKPVRAERLDDGTYRTEYGEILNLGFTGFGSEEGSSIPIDDKMSDFVKGLNEEFGWSSIKSDNPNDYWDRISRSAFNPSALKDWGFLKGQKLSVGDIDNKLQEIEYKVSQGSEITTENVAKVKNLAENIKYLLEQGSKPTATNIDKENAQKAVGIAERIQNLRNSTNSKGKVFTFKKGGPMIKPKNRGKFTAWAKAHNMTVAQATSKVLANKDKYSPSVVKMANFSRNFGGHKEGGIIRAQQGSKLSESFKRIQESNKRPIKTNTTVRIGTSVKEAVKDPLQWISAVGTGASFIPGVGLIGGGVSTVADTIIGARDGWGKEDWRDLAANLGFTALGAVGLGGAAKLSSKAIKATKTLKKVEEVGDIAKRSDIKAIIPKIEGALKAKNVGSILPQKATNIARTGLLGQQLFQGVQSVGNVGQSINEHGFWEGLGEANVQDIKRIGQTGAATKLRIQDRKALKPYKPVKETKTKNTTKSSNKVASKAKELGSKLKNKVTKNPEKKSYTIDEFAGKNDVKSRLIEVLKKKDIKTFTKKDIGENLWNDLKVKYPTFVKKEGGKIQKFSPGGPLYNNSATTNYQNKNKTQYTLPYTLRENMPDNWQIQGGKYTDAYTDFVNNINEEFYINNIDNIHNYAKSRGSNVRAGNLEQLKKLMSDGMYGPYHEWTLEEMQRQGLFNPRGLNPTIDLNYGPLRYSNPNASSNGLRYSNPNIPAPHILSQPVTLDTKFNVPITPETNSDGVIKDWNPINYTPKNQLYLKPASELLNYWITARGNARALNSYINAAAQVPKISLLPHMNLTTSMPFTVRGQENAGITRGLGNRIANSTSDLNRSIAVRLQTNHDALATEQEGFARDVAINNEIKAKQAEINDSVNRTNLQQMDRQSALHADARKMIAQLQDNYAMQEAQNRNNLRAEFYRMYATKPLRDATNQYYNATMDPNLQEGTEYYDYLRSPEVEAEYKKSYDNWATEQRLITPYSQIPEWEQSEQYQKYRTDPEKFARENLNPLYDRISRLGQLMSAQRNMFYGQKGGRIPVGERILLENVKHNNKRLLEYEHNYYKSILKKAELLQKAMVKVFK